jgi:hypothetical protein
MDQLVGLEDIDLVRIEFGEARAYVLIPAELFFVVLPIILDASRRGMGPKRATSAIPSGNTDAEHVRRLDNAPGVAAHTASHRQPEPVRTGSEA